MMWNYYQPVKIYFGAGEVQKIDVYMEENGLENALLIADPFVVNSGLAARVQQASGGRILSVIGDVEPNPTIENVENCAAEARRIGAECVVALGGGSSIDCAKTTAVVLKQKCGARDLLNGTPIEAAFPIMAISTTAGTGSEVTAGAVLSDNVTGKKAAVFGNAIFAKAAIVDPELTYTCPPGVTSRSGIDVIAHALDAMTSVKANPVTDGLAVWAAKTAFSYLEKVVEDGGDKEAREKMSEACITAGLAFSQTGTTGSHACSYILTSAYGIPHGEACAVTLDWWFRENAKVKPQLNEYAGEMGFQDVEAVCQKLCEMKRKFGFKVSPADVGIAETDLDLVVASCMESGNMSNNIAQPGAERLKAMFRTAY